jgi:hypothetical protein
MLNSHVVSTPIDSTGSSISGCWSLSNKPVASGWRGERDRLRIVIDDHRLKDVPADHYAGRAGRRRDLRDHRNPAIFSIS